MAQMSPAAGKFKAADEVISDGASQLSKGCPEAYHSCHESRELKYVPGNWKSYCAIRTMCFVCMAGCTPMLRLTYVNRCRKRLNTFSYQPQCEKGQVGNP